MTQFVLATFTQPPADLHAINQLGDRFLRQSATKLLNGIPPSNIYTFDIDGLMLEAQRLMPKVPFEQTNLYKTIVELAKTAQEIVIWYGSDHHDLAIADNESDLLKQLKDALEDPCCEAYIRYKP